MCRLAHQQKTSAVPALKFLQTQVAQVVSVQDAADFERLSGWLFASASAVDGDDERVELYERVSKVFAVSKRPPSARLQDYLLG